MWTSLEANQDKLSAIKLLHLARKTQALEENLSKCKGSTTFRALPCSTGAGPEEVNLVDSMASNHFIGHPHKGPICQKGKRQVL